jgi:phosphohistidine phosphatase
MKQLILVRHAKSDAGDTGRQDIDRQLAARGIRDAHHVAEWLLQHCQSTDQLVTSSADRALHTAMIFSRTLAIPSTKIVIEPMVYEAPAAALYKVIRALPPTADKVLMFGHNPGFTDVANDLARDFYIDNLPTCGVVGFSLPINSWSEASQGSALHLFHYFPKLATT